MGKSGSSGRREMVEKKILIIIIWVKEMGWEGGVCFIIIKSR